MVSPSAKLETMEGQKHQRQGYPTIRDLYPTLTEIELKQAEANFRRYFEIADAILSEKPLTGADFDKFADPATMEERSNANLKT